MGELEIKRRQGRRETNAMEEKYDLKWKTYSDHLVGVFKELGEEGHFADVTLVSDDQIQTKAHKVVLSACSPVLKTLLVNNPHSHPLLYLRGINQAELQAILKFMYFGETQIFENRINDFVSVAKDLEVKEISEEQDDEENENETHPPESDQEAGTAETVVFEEKIVDEPVVKTETGNRVRAVAKPPTKGQSVIKSGRTWSCQECDATFGSNVGLRNHKKTKHEGKTIPAPSATTELQP